MSYGGATGLLLRYLEMESKMMRLDDAGNDVIDWRLLHRGGKVMRISDAKLAELERLP